MSFYNCLGISKNATPEEIKKAYKHKASEHHPDRHPEAEQAKHAELFKEVINAFNVLSDPVKKSHYDRQGYYGRKPTSPKPPKPKQKVKTKADFEREFAEKKQAEDRTKVKTKLEPMDIKCNFYGNSKNSGRSIEVHVKLTPDELKNGCEKTIQIKKRDFCGMCGGDGEGLFPCKVCGNNRKIKQFCVSCNGNGEVDGTCAFCNGDGLRLWIVENVTFKVPKNSQSGHSIMLIGQGEMASKKSPGNVRIVVL